MAVILDYSKKRRRIFSYLIHLKMLKFILVKTLLIIDCYTFVLSYNHILNPKIWEFQLLWQYLINYILQSPQKKHALRKNKFPSIEKQHMTFASWQSSIYIGLINCLSSMHLFKHIPRKADTKTHLHFVVQSAVCKMF